MKQLTVSVCSPLWSPTLGYAITSNRIGSLELKENAFTGPCACKVLYCIKKTTRLSRGFLDTKRNCRHFDSSFSVTCFSELKIRNTFCIDPSLENSRINKTRINLFLFFRKTERFLSKRDTLH